MELPKKHDAATVDAVRYLLNSIPDDSSPKHIRDRVIIALGFAGAFRRFELCALMCSPCQGQSNFRLLSSHEKWCNL